MSSRSAARPRSGDGRRDRGAKGERPSPPPGCGRRAAPGVFPVASAACHAGCCVARPPSARSGPWICARACTCGTALPSPPLPRALVLSTSSAEPVCSACLKFESGKMGQTLGLSNVELLSMRELAAPAVQALCATAEAIIRFGCNENQV